MTKKHNISIDKGFNISYDNLSDIDKSIFLEFLKKFEEDPKYIIDKSDFLEKNKKLHFYPISENLRIIYYLHESDIAILEIVDISKDENFKHLYYNSFDLLNHQESKKIHNKIIILIMGILLLIVSIGLFIALQSNRGPSNDGNRINTGNIILTGNIVNTGNLNTTGETMIQYRFFSGEQTFSLISSGNDFTLKGGETDRLEYQYPQIIVKDQNISGAVLRVVVDFKSSWVQYNGGFVYGYSVSKDTNGKTIRKPAPGYCFTLKFGFGGIKGGDVVYGGRYDVMSYSHPSGTAKYTNDENFGLNGCLPGSEIIGGREYIIPLDSVIIGYQPRKTPNDPAFRRLYPLSDYLKKNINKPIIVAARLSDAGMRNTVIKEMEIIYTGTTGAIEKYSN